MVQVVELSYATTCWNFNYNRKTHYRDDVYTQSARATAVAESYLNDLFAEVAAVPRPTILDEVLLVARFCLTKLG